jgi:RNA polymerase sigma-70 factor (family 1)
LHLPAQDILYLQNKVAYLRDEQAYKKIFLHFYPSLKKFALSIVQNNEVAEEIVSDTMMKIWEAGSKIAQIEKIDSYLFTAIKNNCLTSLKKYKAETIEIDETISVQEQDLDPLQCIEMAETKKVIKDCVGKLPPQCVMVYTLVKEEGFPYKKVSDILGISQNTIETHMRIALKRIRLALTNYLLEKK